MHLLGVAKILNFGYQKEIMKRLSLTWLIGSVLYLVLTSLTVFAQSEKIPVSFIPKPNQVSHLRLQTEMQMEMTFEGDLPPEMAAMNPMKMNLKSVIGLTQKTGPVNKQGKIEMEITYDEVASEMTMNGNPVPLGDLGAQTKGKKITATFTQQGEMVEVNAPADMPVTKDALKELMKSVYGNLPKDPLAIGETATMPLNMALPLPGIAPINLGGQMKIKLARIDKDGTSRIARLDQIIDATLLGPIEFASPQGQIKMNFDFKMTGTGFSELDVDKVLVKSGESTTTLEGKASAPANSAVPIPGFSIKGIVKTVITGTN